MPKTIRFLSVLAVFISLQVTPIQAQDPFFTHFFNAESQFNPALVGYRGAVSLGVKYKTQWSKMELPVYETSYASYEESMPCSILDYGFSISKDVEGSGLLKTIQAGGQVAGVIPLSDFINIRLGGGFQWGQKRIDYSRLIFSDQLHPKYGLSDAAGIDYVSSFSAPNDGESLVYFAPSVGFTFQLLPKGGSSSILFGGALHNAYDIGDGAYRGNVASVLGTGTFLPKRITAFGSYEWIFEDNDRYFLSLKGIGFYQKQNTIDMITTGLKLSYNKNAAVGFYAQFNEKQAEGANTNWFTWTLDFGWMVSKYNRIDFGFAYSANFSGLRNRFGPIGEFSTVFHFGKSPVCRWANQDDDLTQEGIFCKLTNFTRKHRKMYEKIWYKNN